MHWMWLIAGFALGAIASVPVVWWLHRREGRRTEDARQRATASERLAEIGTMTSGLAHEIKNPLSTVGLNAQLLSEDLARLEIDEEEREQLLRRLDGLSREVDRLRGILSDFLQFAGRMILDREELDLRDLLSELEDFYHHQCESDGLVLRVQVPVAPVVVNIDGPLLKQAILNLLINASQAIVEAGDGGELIVRLEESRGQAFVHVIDTGPGIEPERLGEIFHPYVSSKRGGTGLGLATSQRIVEEHGGLISVDSETGKGSDFTISIPVLDS